MEFYLKYFVVYSEKVNICDYNEINCVTFKITNMQYQKTIVCHTPAIHALQPNNANLCFTPP